LIALFRREPGSDAVRKKLRSAVISAVNYSEVLKKTVERGGSAETAEAFVRHLSLPVVAFDREIAVMSANLYPLTKAHGMSFADRACLALGVQRNAEVLTTERRMGDVALDIKVTVIRGRH
jgi:PIN domain nuclease of toxin-antitoxin system